MLLIATVRSADGKARRFCEPGILPDGSIDVEIDVFVIRVEPNTDFKQPLAEQLTDYRSIR
jgi:hypothetical protein